MKILHESGLLSHFEKLGKWNSILKTKALYNFLPKLENNQYLKFVVLMHFLKKNYFKNRLERGIGSKFRTFVRN